MAGAATGSGRAQELFLPVRGPRPGPGGGQRRMSMAAADKRVDNRVMFSAGAAALELGWLGQAGIAMGIPLSARGKSIYFDRRS